MPLRTRSSITGYGDYLHGQVQRIARLVLMAFLSTFVSVRILVLLIMTGRLPDLYITIGGTHIHHLNLGIFMLACVGAVFLFHPHVQLWLRGLAITYGIGMALTFDEFGMWLHLGGSYWQRASWDAIIVLTGVLFLLAFGRPLSQVRWLHLLMAGLLLAGIVAFFILLVQSLRF
ncbi:MAG: hypothetical protein QHH07_03680 [Sedimentisphaerales bacterium]|jgi:hypothetical protein|nr:hypothetical protein [Sedimentisphaerales bacterium]